ncbi:ABC transporter ATP-binding protein [Nocardioides sp. cx-173]|uniref:ABC transporter ATP-binding protein n=1 Tax=Nocardioides sp. cx-173 TaxID=2898796 RepID=UPI001E443C24|nr:sn-glycerol-3-phosphate ABC transporter ATP-binding protein UgpC [Nocardioides sp. cx-173]MCD4525549.1 sn-glycerol-3-phosphate ABC transporter ATP-binding protein UgpC [Nocardioides sp. cx-173]UGB42693.1 sn-glycerol-3-phosphate ABC transporter ATP-binding protein UgpC [Nocardioides sp. cx-173]
MAAIDMKNIVKKYGDGFPAVNDVSIDVHDGEFMILVGPSGCGKSTLLRMIVGLEDITSGDMIIGDRRVNDLPPKDRNLAMVFQNYALYPHLTVYENIAFPLRLAKVDDKTVDEKVRAASKTLELDEHLERKPANLSGGQRQRVAMGRAIVRDADAFLFDEPLSNLDAKLRGQMRSEIARLQKKLGITTVYVTHDQTEAMTLGDRVAVLKRGILQQLASPRELYTNPGNLFVAGFIGSPPMNFLPATVDGTTVELPFGKVEISPEKASAAAGRGLLIAGIRPEAFEDASVVDPSRKGSTFRAKVDQVEWLGNTAYAYIPFEAPPEVQEQLQQLERDLDGETVRTQLVISLDGSSRIAEDDEADIWVDTSQMHLFDPATGENLTLDLEHAGRVPSLEQGHDPAAQARSEHEVADQQTAAAEAADG